MRRIINGQPFGNFIKYRFDVLVLDPDAASFDGAAADENLADEFRVRRVAYVVLAYVAWTRTTFARILLRRLIRLTLHPVREIQKLVVE